MKICALLFSLVMGLGLVSVPARAGQLSAKNLDVLDQWGWFTPGFKSSVHEFVDTKQALAQVQKEGKDLDLTLPGLQTQATAAQARVSSLKLELAQYENTDQSDFAQLQKIATDAAARPDDVRVAAQAYVWGYPNSSHQAEAQQILQTVQKKIADQTQAEKDADAARVAARALLVQRAQAKQLSLAEWRDFLRDMSEEDVLKYLGQPTYRQEGSWIYSGEWTEDPQTHDKIGLQIGFNAARVVDVAKVPAK